MKTTLAKWFLFFASFMFCFSIDFNLGSTPRIYFIKDAKAIVGAPLTPGSVAGTTRRVARRTIRRRTAVVAGTAASAGAASAAASSKPAPTTIVVAEPKPAAPPAKSGTAVPVGTIIPTLPDGCKSVVISGATYFNCADVHYKPAFQGSALVYVVVEKPQ